MTSLPDQSAMDGRVKPGTRWVGGGRTIEILGDEHDDYFMFAARVIEGKGRGEKVYVPPKEFGTRLRPDSRTRDESQRGMED